MQRTNRKSQLGFSLIEVMVVLLITTILGGILFKQINSVQQGANTEEQKLDLFQEARDFMDQMSRDLHQAGYPNPHNFQPNQVSGPSDPQAAVGLVKVDVGSLWFEGDVDGTGKVSVVHYELVATGNNCPCLRRSQQYKISADPMSQGNPVYYTEIQNVQNGTGTNPIFYAFRTDNSAVTLPVDFDNNATDIANINEIQVVVTAQSKYIDARTRVQPSVTMVSTVKLNNCSQATSGQSMSCQ